MSTAICFKCSAEKSGSLHTYTDCGPIPQLDSVLVLLILLSWLFSTKTSLAKYHGLSNHLMLSVSSAELAKVKKGLKDPQLMAMHVAHLSAQASSSLTPTTALSRLITTPINQSVLNVLFSRIQGQCT